jgi:hypothetical protein
VTGLKATLDQAGQPVSKVQKIGCFYGVLKHFV